MKDRLGIFYLLTLIVIAGVLAISAYATTGNSIAIQVPIGPYPTTVAADDLDITWTAAGGANVINSVTSTGRELLLIRSVANAVADVSLYTVADQYNRTNNIAAYVLGVSETAAFWLGNTVGWRNATGAITIEASTTCIEWAVLRITK